MVPIPRGSTAYKVAARESAPSGELPSDRHDEPQPVQSPYHLTCGGHRCRSLDRSSPQPSRKKERDIDVELDIERPIQVRLATRRSAGLRLPGRNCRLREPDRQAPTLAQGGIILGPVRHLVLLLGKVVAAVLVQLERQGR